MASNSFNILSLSGGGCRGIFQAVYLERLEETIGEPLWKHFDLIAGTSTGAIVALAVALGISPNRIKELYKNKAHKIFTPKTFLASEKLAGLRKGPIYDQNQLKQSLVDVFGTSQIRDAKTQVLITASCLDQFSHRIFSSFQNDTPADQSLSVVDVALSSSAAPTYFAPVKPVSKETSYIDGGLWANSPSLVALLLANTYLDAPVELIKILSIGTGDFPKGILSDNFVNFRKYSIETVKTLYEVMFAAQESSSDSQALMLLENKHFMRISASLDEFISLDDANAAISKLPPLAEIQADKTINNIVSFLNNEVHSTTCRRHRLKCLGHRDNLVSDELIDETGLTAFYPGRKYYSHRKSAESIDSYVDTAQKSVIMVSINLMTGIPFAGLCDCLKTKLENHHDSFNVVISLLNPKKSGLIFAISPSLTRTEEELSYSINSTLENLFDFREKLNANSRNRIDIRVHEAIPFGSAIIIDHEEEYGRIQIETKPYKTKIDESFAFEVAPSGNSGFFQSLLNGYTKLIADGHSLIKQ